MGNARTHQSHRKRLRKELRARGYTEDEIDRRIAAKARRQLARRHGGLVLGPLTPDEHQWITDARRRHPRLSDTTLQLLIHEHRLADTEP